MPVLPFYLAIFIYALAAFEQFGFCLNYYAIKSENVLL